MHPKYLIFSLLLFVGGCVTTADPMLPGLFPPYAGRPIVPIKGLKIGEVYRTDTANVAPDQVSYIVPICTADFKETAALKKIAKKYQDPSLFVDTGGGSVITRNINASGNISGVKIRWLSLGANAGVVNSVTYNVQGVKRIDVEPGDESIIRSKLGKKCKALIRSYKAKGYSAFIVAGAWRASTLTTTVDLKPSAGVTASFNVLKAFSPATKMTYSDEQKIVSTGKNQYFVVVPLSD